MTFNPAARPKSFLSSTMRGEARVLGRGVNTASDTEALGGSFQAGTAVWVTPGDCSSKNTSLSGLRGLQLLKKHQDSSESDSTEAGSVDDDSNGESNGESNRFGKMQPVFDIFRDNSVPIDLAEDPLREFLPTVNVKEEVKVASINTSLPGIASVVTFPGAGGEDSVCGINRKPQFHRTCATVEYIPPFSSPEAWSNQQDVAKSPVFPLGEPTKIFQVAPNCASELTKHKHWTEEEDAQLCAAIQRETAFGQKQDWKIIAKTYFGNTRSGTQCKVRWKNHLKPGIKRGKWLEHEDKTILFMVQQGHKWAEIAHRLSGRISENVRDRYVNFLDPSLKKIPWTEEEDAILFENQAILGNRWSAIRKLIPGRSENSIKNRYHNRKNSHLRKLKREAEERELVEAGYPAPWNAAAV